MRNYPYDRKNLTKRQGKESSKSCSSNERERSGGERAKERLDVEVKGKELQSSTGWWRGSHAYFIFALTNFLPVDSSGSEYTRLAARS